jgi:hypothetical protein
VQAGFSSLFQIGKLQARIFGLYFFAKNQPLFSLKHVRWLKIHNLL